MRVNMAIYSYRLIFIPQLSVSLVVSYIDTVFCKSVDSPKNKLALRKL